MELKYSVLMSLYRKENPDFFRDSLESIVNQSLRPNQIVLVQDGPITSELQDVVDDYHNYLDIVVLHRNQGLGKALSVGVNKCRNELIARMDTDDIAIQNRMKDQLLYLNEHPNIDVLGGYISEFQHTVNDEKQNIRKVPILNQDIKLFAKKRNPMNHVTIMFRRSAVLKSGNYLSFIGFEDYYLWIRMIKLGFKFQNIPRVLVKVRTSEDMIDRRKGAAYAKKELKFQCWLKKSGFISLNRYLINLVVRVGIRFLPRRILLYIYLLFAREQ